MKRFIYKLLWRLQFKKVTLKPRQWQEGRCLECDAGNPLVECGTYGKCPCNYKEHLKRIRTFKFLYKTSFHEMQYKYKK